ncbi:MAG: hypothetical protein DMG06_24840 [Acidobacteria bacterium]|nr:MAG: hypothetical protein DMG06_24840 [Acidobacteriota bacterium]
MNCEKSRELFADYIGGELSQSDARELKDHLSTCQACRQELSLLSSTKAALKVGWPDESIPQSLTFEFLKPSPQRFSSQLGWFSLPKFAWISLAVSACFIVCLWSLALLRTQIQIENGKFKLSFGQPVQLVSTNTPTQLNSLAPLKVNNEVVQALIAQVLERFEQNQNTKLQQALQEAKAEWEAKRNADFVRIAKEFKYLESTQNVVWKEAVRNSSVLDALARDLYVKTNSSVPVQQ